MAWKIDELGLETLKRIVAMLFSMACMADSAAHRRWQVRRDVIDIIGVGEAAALHAAAGLSLDLGLAQRLPGEHPAYLLMPDGDDPEDAIALAMRLRAIAFVLANLVMLAELLHRNGQGDTLRGRNLRILLGGRPDRNSGWACGFEPAPALSLGAIRAPPLRAR